MALDSLVEFSDINLGVVCPMANERTSAASFVKEVLHQCESRNFKSVKFFVILDNISTDGTFELLKNLEKTEPRLQVVWSPENRSVADAYIRGYREALQAEADWILEIDAGYSHQPSDIPQFFEKMAQGYACVFGSRFCEGGAMQGPIKRHVISRGGTVLTNLLLGTKLKDMTSGFEAFTRPALKEVLDKGIRSRCHFFQTEIKAHCRKLRIAEVPIRYQTNSDSVNNMVINDAFANLWRLFRLRMTGNL